ncbi:DUF4190 domain-containing protein [Microbacterium tumbae]
MSDGNGDGTPQNPNPGDLYGATGHGQPGGFPDPSLAAAYPSSPVPGEQQAVAHAQQYAGYGAPSAFAGPPTPSTGAGGLAIAALIVGIAAFLTSLIPVLGLVLAVAGIVVGILAVRRARGRGLSITGLVLSGIALLTGIVVAVFWFLVLPFAAQSTAEQIEQWSDEIESSAPVDEDAGDAAFDETEFSVVSGQLIETPCWSYDGPQHFTDNISADAVAACNGKLELWGESDAEGNVTPTGVGAIFGQIGVEPIRVSTAEGYAPGTDPVAVVDALEESYFAPQGEIESLHEEATLGGVPADVTRIDSDAELTETKAFITAYAPAPYDVEGEQVQLFIISIVTPYENGDELIQQVLDTWQWR